MQLHKGELDVSEALVASLVAEQFPAGVGLPIVSVASAGTDNTLWRLGDDLVVRLPRMASPSGALARQHRWLPWLASQLPIAVPTPVAFGQPTAAYPNTWAIHRWLSGRDATTTPFADLPRTAAELAGFVRALWSIDPTDGPAPRVGGSGRGLPLGGRDAATRQAIASLGDAIDATPAADAWQLALRAGEWDRPPVWIHGDLLPGNLLVIDGQLSAVIDFGPLAVGDPAIDLLPAWSVFDRSTRIAFRAALDVDDDTWRRGWGWALTIGLVALPYYEHTNPPFAAVARRLIDEALADDP